MRGRDYHRLRRLTGDSTEGFLTNLTDDVTPTLGGSLDLNSNAFVAQLQAAESLVDGDVCYIATSGKMAKADATVAASANTMLAICTETLTADAVGTFVVRGFYTTSGLSAGTLLYLSTTAGVWSSATPTGSGEVVRILGYAMTATQMFFDPDKTWIELA